MLDITMMQSLVQSGTRKTIEIRSKREGYEVLLDD